jgi:hypothetical protein
MTGSSSDTRETCPAGANPTTTAEKSLNKRKSRACGVAGELPFSAWCTRVKDVRTLLMSGAPGSEL